MALVKRKFPSLREKLSNQVDKENIGAKTKPSSPKVEKKSKKK